MRHNYLFLGHSTHHNKISSPWKLPSLSLDYSIKYSWGKLSCQRPYPHVFSFRPHNCSAGKQGRDTPLWKWLINTARIFFREWFARKLPFRCENQFQFLRGMGMSRINHHWESFPVIAVGHLILPISKVYFTRSWNLLPHNTAKDAPQWQLCWWLRFMLDKWIVLRRTRCN